MTLREHVLQQALALPVPDHAYVAHELENHLIANLPSETEEPGGHFDSELLTELRRRSVAYRSGAITACNAADAMAELWQRQNEVNLRLLADAEDDIESARRPNYWINRRDTGS